MPMPPHCHMVEHNQGNAIYPEQREFLDGKNGAIRFRMGEPDYSDIKGQEFNWSRTVYGNVEEIEPYVIPDPQEK